MTAWRLLLLRRSFSFPPSAFGGASLSLAIVSSLRSRPEERVPRSLRSRSNSIAQSAYASGNNTNPYTANLPAAPLQSTNFDVYFLDGGDDLGPSAPTGTPAVTNLIYVKAGAGTAGTYFGGTPSQNESFAGANKH